MPFIYTQKRIQSEAGFLKRKKFKVVTPGVFAPISCMLAGNASLPFPLPSPPLSILYPVIVK
jgi:hypothetical protein